MILLIGSFLFFSPSIMANMSYCMFQNTSGDLEDCADFMSDNADVVASILDGTYIYADPTDDDEEDLLSDREVDALRKLVDLCIGVAQEFGS